MQGRRLTLEIAELQGNQVWPYTPRSVIAELRLWPSALIMSTDTIE
jgi:hypothetical protein